MQQVVQFDVNRQLPRPGERVAAQMAFGAACAVAMIAVHIIMDSRLPEASPFALVYPSVVIATLYGHWRGGATAWLIGSAYAWYFLLPFALSFRFADETGAAKAALSMVSAAIVVAFAETFRRYVLAAMEERDAEIARRAMLLQELEHRTRNNFALVLSLLEMQKRREADPCAEKALDLATSRIRSFARAYANLAQGRDKGVGGGERVAMRPYLREVVTHFADGAFPERITVRYRAADCSLPRETAVAIGLFTNEALTNCAKYAFPDERSGTVSVTLKGNAQGWELVVADDGVGDGAPRGPRASAGLGTTLMRAFADQAHADYTLETSVRGRRARLASR